MPVQSLCRPFASNYGRIHDGSDTISDQGHGNTGTVIAPMGAPVSSWHCRLQAIANMWSSLELTKATMETRTSMAWSFVCLASSRGAVHEGNGTHNWSLTRRRTRRSAKPIRRIAYNEDTDELKTHWAVYNAMSSTVLDPIIAPIELQADIGARSANASVKGLVESRAEPIKNPVTGVPHQAQIVLAQWL